MLENKEPAVDARLVEHLEREFKDRLPLLSQADLNEINVKIGEQRVIRYLRRLCADQTDNSTPIR